MPDKKPKVNSLAYTELSIQIATLSAKVDKLLELAMKPKFTAKDHERDLRYKTNFKIPGNTNCDQITPLCIQNGCDCPNKEKLEVVSEEEWSETYK